MMPRENQPKKFVTARKAGLMPHWRATGAIYEVAFHLDGALPKSRQAEIEELRAEIKEGRLRAINLSQRRLEMIARSEQEATRRKWMADPGPGLLADPRCAGVVEAVMIRGHRWKFDLLAWSVMPNHVHAVIHPYDGVDVSDIVKAWKGASNRSIRGIVGGSGPIWQREYFDRIMRTAGETYQAVRYAIENPDAIGMHEWPFRGAMGFGTELLRSVASASHLLKWCREG